MTPTQYRASLLDLSPVLPGGQPYGVERCGGDINDVTLDRETWLHILAMLDDQPLQRIIQIGSGGGRWTRRLAQIAANMLCVDQASRSQAHIDALHLSVPIMHYHCRHWSLPTRPGSPLHETFDLAIALDVYPYAQQYEIIPSIQATTDALRPGGLSVIQIGTLCRQTETMPVDTTGLWQYREITWIEHVIQHAGLDIIHRLYETEGYGSVVVFARKRGTSS